MVTLRVHTAKGEHSLDIRGSCSVREALDVSDLRVPAACGGVGSCGACLVRVVGGKVSPPTLAEYQKLSAEERARGWRFACQLRLEGEAEIELDRPAPPSRWRSIPHEELPPCPEGEPSLERAIYGVAVDLGTSHIRVSLLDRKRGKRIATRWGPNPQVAWGADVLNRLSAAQTNPHRARECSDLARGGILQAICDMLVQEAGEVDSLLPEIGRLVVVGNTAMLALLTEEGGDALLDPEHWQRPIDYRPHDPEAWRARWPLPNADLLLPPPLAGFVGSDLLASILATRLLEGPSGSVLLDVGTNTEIALWDGEILHVSSVPGGPAFEGAGIRFGMAAEPGAIAHVVPRPGGQGFSCEILGGPPAHGFCGSGLISGVAVLRSAGILKSSGRFAFKVGPEGHVLDPTLPRSAITARAVDAVQRGKAATASAIEELLEQAGLGWLDLRRFCVCGAFGKHLDIDQAQAVGLLPTLDGNTIELCSNAALSGCELGLLAADMEAMFRGVAGKSIVTNMSCIPAWEERYIAHLRLAPIPCAPCPRGAT